MVMCKNRETSYLKSFHPNLLLSFLWMASVLLCCCLLHCQCDQFLWVIMDKNSYGSFYPNELSTGVEAMGHLKFRQHSTSETKSTIHSTNWFVSVSIYAQWGRISCNLSKAAIVLYTVFPPHDLFPLLRQSLTLKIFERAAVSSQYFNSACILELTVCSIVRQTLISLSSFDSWRTSRFSVWKPRTCPATRPHAHSDKCAFERTA